MPSLWGYFNGYVSGAFCIERKRDVIISAEVRDNLTAIDAALPTS